MIERHPRSVYRKKSGENHFRSTFSWFWVYFNKHTAFLVFMHSLLDQTNSFQSAHSGFFYVGAAGAVLTFVYCHLRLIPTFAALLFQAAHPQFLLKLLFSIFHRFDVWLLPLLPQIAVPFFTFISWINGNTRIVKTQKPERNRAMVLWSGAFCPANNHMKLVGLIKLCIV